MTSLSSRYLILGAGYVGARLARLARQREHEVIVTARSPERTEALRREGFEVRSAAALDASIGQLVDARTHVALTFPPDGATDRAIAPALRGACSVTYLSTTGVYDDTRGDIDDDTPVPARPSARSQRYLDAEACYRALGATILRSPAIYGPDRGLHVRIATSRHRIPGDGQRFISRIHADDLAELLYAARALRGETFVVGDLEPTPHLDVVRWVCATRGLPLPPFEPLESAADSLRADRRVRPQRALARLGVTLRYPSYRDGMAP